jgi:iron complex transport system permease protein
MLQTAFNNPLAGPSILGINSGASLGVALVMLLGGGTIATAGITLSGFFSIVLGAFIGSMVVMGLILFFSTLIKSNIMLLITGIMIGYITSSAISLLNFFATAEGVHSYMIWGMGNFSGVSLEQMPYFAIFTLSGLTLAILLIKPLNALLLGTRYAENLGVNIKRTRNLLLIATGILTAVTTAFCGPVSFIGLAVPHIARLLLGTSNHNSLLPVTLLTGSAIALLCNLICILPGESGIIPLNAVTPVLGAPVIIYVIINQRRIQYFN